MTGFVQVAPDGSGKQLDNDVVTIPVGTIITDGAGNQTTLSAPAYYFRERIVNSDPVDPAGVGRVRNSDPLVGDYGIVARLPAGQADLQTIAAYAQSIDANIQALALGGPFPSYPETAYPVAGMPPGQLSPTVPRGLICDQFGRQVIVPHGTREALKTANITITNNTANTLIAAVDQYTYTDIVALLVTNTSATAVRVDISDGTQTIPIFPPATDMRGISLGGVIIPATKTNTAWTATVSSSVTDIRVWALYVNNKSQ